MVPICIVVACLFSLYSLHLMILAKRAVVAARPKAALACSSYAGLAEETLGVFGGANGVCHCKIIFIFSSCALLSAASGASCLQACTTSFPPLVTRHPGVFAELVNLSACFGIASAYLVFIASTLDSIFVRCPAAPPSPALPARPFLLPTCPRPASLHARPASPRVRSAARTTEPEASAWAAAPAAAQAMPGGAVVIVWLLVPLMAALACVRDMGNVSVIAIVGDCCVAIGLLFTTAFCIRRGLLPCLALPSPLLAPPLLPPLLPAAASLAPFCRRRPSRLCPRPLFLGKPSSGSAQAAPALAL